MNPETGSFATLLRQYREAATLTQEQLAERAGLTAKAIGALERGERRSPYPRTLLALATALKLADTERTRLIASVPRRIPPTNGHQRASTAEWITRTKLAPPAPGAATIERPALETLLAESVAGVPLTVLSAPAGYGKSTLLATLPHRRPARAVAWLSLDEEDNDPAHFGAALVAAFRTIAPDDVAATAILAPPAELTGKPRGLIGYLINAVLGWGDAPLTLVLDDLHQLTEPAIHRALDYLLERLPPQLHVAVATRHDPPLALARLRARRQLREFRLEDLRFTPEEAKRYFRDALQLELSDETRRRLYARTEGWPAGLTLLVDSLDHGTAREGHCRLPSRLAHVGRHLSEYLADEVYHRMSPDTRAFLLATAVLGDLTPDRCDALTGRQDSARLLDALYRDNLFLSLVSEEGPTYRYHDCFRDFLRQRLAEQPVRLRPTRAAVGARW